MTEPDSSGVSEPLPSSPLASNPTGWTASAVSAGERRRREIMLAMANGLKLGGSMVVTWGIALIGRLFVPRFLGPERFGVLNFADAFCTTAYVVLGLGLDTYVRREISVRPKHASDFIGGVLVVRLILLVLVSIAIEPILDATHRSAEVRVLIYIYGLSQFFMADSNTTAGLLQAVGKVNAQSVLSIVIKLALLVCILVAIGLRLGLWAFAATIAFTEGLKAVAFFFMARKELGFKIQVRVKPTLQVLVAALPFFISGLATTIYGRAGVSILAFMSTDREVGWFGAASGLHSLSLMLVSIFAWVLTPLLARTAANSKEELYSVVRPALALTLGISTPLALAMIVGADYGILLAFGKPYAPAALALRILAIATPLMYTSIVAAYTLAVLNLTWRMAAIFLSGLVVSPLANWLLIPPMARALGVGGSGAACAASVVVTEIAVAVPLAAMLGRNCFDRPLVAKIVKTMLAAAAVVALDAWVLQAWGPVRLAVDFALYALLVVGSGAFDVKGTIRWLKDARNKAQPAVGPS